VALFNQNIDPIAKAMYFLAEIVKIEGLLMDFYLGGVERGRNLWSAYSGQMSPAIPVMLCHFSNRVFAGHTCRMRNLRVIQSFGNGFSPSPKHSLPPPKHWGVRGTRKLWGVGQAEVGAGTTIVSVISGQWKIGRSNITVRHLGQYKVGADLFTVNG